MATRRIAVAETSATRGETPGVSPFLTCAAEAFGRPVCRLGLASHDVPDDRFLGCGIVQRLPDRDVAQELILVQLYESVGGVQIALDDDPGCALHVVFLQPI